MRISKKFVRRDNTKQKSTKSGLIRWGTEDMDTTSGDDSEGEGNYNHGDLYKSMIVDIDDSSDESMYRQLNM